MHDAFIDELLIVLTTGLLAGYLCRQLSLPPLMGYLALGSVVGDGMLGLISADVGEIAHLAELGVFFLLFSIGLELSIEELQKMGRRLLIGGSLQMLLVAAPVAAVLIARSWDVRAALLVACAMAFSSTVLVFRSLSELGQTSTALGRKAISILLFQDAALVPLLLCIPMLSDAGEASSAREWLLLGAVSVGFVGATVLLRSVLNRWVIPRVAQHHSPDLVVLMTLAVLGTVTLVAHRVGLPPALGAFAAGLAFGGNRWSEQVDSLILPFREAFAAVFFVSLGLLIDVTGMIREPVVIASAVLLLTMIKAVAAAIALLATGQRWRTCWRPAIGLAHVGEFAFVLILVGATAGIITPEQQARLITVAGATLLLAPLLIHWGFEREGPDSAREEPEFGGLRIPLDPGRCCVVIGMGPVGRAVAARLETLGFFVSAVDSNPLNLQGFAQHGFRAVSGDGSRKEVLRNAGVDKAPILVVCVPIDEVARRITEGARGMNPEVRIIVRCRYAREIGRIRKAGANVVISEEARSTQALVEAVESVTNPG